MVRMSTAATSSEGAAAAAASPALRRVSTFCSVTFHGQSKVIFNTNATGQTRAKVLGLLTNILGPFRDNEVEVGSLAVVMGHKAQPFGSVRNLAERESVTVQLCVFFQEMYKLGWKSVGGGIFDPVKRRGNVIFKLQDGPLETDFACLSVQHVQRSRLVAVTPQDWEQKIMTRLAGYLVGRIGAPFSRRREFKARREDSRKVIAQSWELDGYAEAFTVDTASNSVGTILKMVNAMHSLDFHLEASVNIFGPASQSILVFGYKGTRSSPPNEPVWAMTVMNPKKVVLVDAPPDVWQLVKTESDGWRQFGSGDFWGRREDFTLGKMAYIKLITRLATDNWSILHSYDGLYKNSFVLFRRSDTPYLFLESNPKIVSFSSVSDKKLKFDDISSMTHDQLLSDQRGNVVEANRCLSRLDHTFLRPKRSYDNDKIRVFDHCQFAYYNPGTVAKQMCIYLVLMMELELLGYSLYGLANISGRYNIDSDTRGVSPHSLFFMRLPDSVLQMQQQQSAAAAPSSPTASAPTYEAAALVPNSLDLATMATHHLGEDGLPTYEEAMAMMAAEEQTAGAQVVEEESATTEEASP